MIVAFGLGLFAALLSVVAPRVLRSMMLAASPRVMAAAWLTCITAVVFLAGCAVLVSVWPGHASVVETVETTMVCLTAFLHTAPAWSINPCAVLGAVVAAAVTGRLAVTARRLSRAGARIRAYHRDVIAVVARITEDVVPVMWLDHPLPLAYSVDGRPGIIVATDGLARSLTEPQRRAVLAHEHAHLRGHHHLMIRICAVMAAALPWIPLFAAAPRAVATLVELDADEIAATATSRPAMCGALRAVSESASTEHSGLASFGNEVVALRLRRLESASGSTPQRFSAVVALCLPATLAAGIAAASIAGMGGIACLLLP